MIVNVRWMQTGQAADPIGVIKMKQEYRFWLVNAEGCEMMDVRTDNFKNARGTFAAYYSGKYQIIWTDKYGQHNKRNVRL